MNNLLEIVRRLYPNLKNLNETTILSKENEVLGYSATLYNDDNFAISGGTNTNKETARRIAVAEALERGFVRKISKDPIISEQFLLNQIPSSLGFACGFEREKTKLRSFCEGLEKWTLSQIIDFNFPATIQSKFKLTKLAENLCIQFDNIQLFQKKISVNLPEATTNTSLVFSLFIGYTKTGAFPGSCIAFENEDQMTHACIEAHRNFSNYNYLIKKNIAPENLILKRILFFGENKKLVGNQINTYENKVWPTPNLRLLNEYNTEFENIFLFRTLFKDFIPVNAGTVNRFIM